MTMTLDAIDRAIDPDPYAPLTIPEGIDVFQIPTRSYDFNKGDRRFYRQEAALQWAHDEAILTGIRRVVRLSGPATLGGEPLYLVQEVGS